MGIGAISVSLLLRQGTRQITTIVDETVLLNVAEAILDKVVCSLKKESWGKREYKDATRHAFGGIGTTDSGDESGVYINDLGYDGINYYYYIEDVSYQAYYGDVPVDKNIKPDDIVPYLARLYVQVDYKGLMLTIESELKFREPSRLEPTMIIVENFRIIPNPEKKKLTNSPNDEIKNKGRKLIDDAKENRAENSGVNRVIENVVHEKLPPQLGSPSSPGEYSDTRNIEDFAGTDLDLSQEEKEKKISIGLDRAERVFEDFAIEKHNLDTSAGVSVVVPEIDYEDAINEIRQALQEANGQLPEYKLKNFPRSLFYLGKAYMAKGEATEGPAILSSINSTISNPSFYVTDPEDIATTPINEDHEEKLWLGENPPADIPSGSGNNDTNASYSEQSYYFKLAESCFYTIIRQYPESKFALEAYFKLFQVKLLLSSRWGRAYAQNEARKIMKRLRNQVVAGDYPNYYRLFSEDFTINNVNEEVYQSLRKQKIAFHSDRSGNVEIYIVNADGSGVPINITNNATYDGYPAWSPDGNKIAFHSDRNRNGNWEIYTTNADGSETPINLSNNIAGDGYPEWSPDSTRIVFQSSRGSRGEINEIYVINADGSGTPVRITNNPANDCNPSWSPDGTKIAFDSNRDGDYEVYVIDFDESSIPLKITDNTFLDAYPVWSPDSKKVAFQTNRDGNFEIYVANADGSGTPVRITNDPALDWYPAWSPDGTKIAYHTNSDANYEIYVANIDGSGTPVRITNDPATDWHATWSPIIDDPFPDVFAQ